MNAPLLPEVHLTLERGTQAELDLAAEGVLRYVWHGRFGAMLIEVIDDRVYVDGHLVERSADAPAPFDTAASRVVPREASGSA